MQDILIHTCCAPCLCYPLSYLNENNCNITAFWYNPNIHPFEEYQKRLNTLYSLHVKKEINIIYNNDYGLTDWLAYTQKGWGKKNKQERCKLCYFMRLKKTVEYAKENSFKIFTTTLLYSKFQYHDEIKKIGSELAEKHGVEFLYIDFREGWKKGIELSHEYGLYRQKYCGCIFSEYKGDK